MPITSAIGPKISRAPGDHREETCEEIPMTAALDTFLQEFPVVIEIPVQWGEMDAFQHVNNVAYFRYFESVRIAYMNRTSLLESIAKKQIFPVLAATECRYKKALTFPDALHIGCRLGEFQDCGITQTYSIYSQAQDCVTTMGSGRIVLIDPNSGQQIKLSADLRLEVEAIEQGR